MGVATIVITHVEPIVITIPFEHGGPKPMRLDGPWATMDSLLVRIDTDAGITGWGEAFGFGVCAVTHAAVKHVLAKLCVGRDPEKPADIMSLLRKSTQNAGTSGPLRYGISGIEIALWDILGKIRQQPLSELLGGAKRSLVPTYASFLPYHDAALVERNVEECLQLGYRAIKLHERDAESVAASRRTGGDAFELMLDTNCAWTPAEAGEMAKKLEPFNLAWLEEPIYPPDDFEALAALRACTSIPIAIGENLGSLLEVRRATAQGAYDIVQPDAIKIGGVVEMMDAMAVATAAGLRAYPHSPFFGPAIVATLHAISTLDDETTWCERFYCDLEAYVAGEATVSVTGGMMTVPQGPGLGVTIDESVIARYRVI